MRDLVLQRHELPAQIVLMTSSHSAEVYSCSAFWTVIPALLKQTSSLPYLAAIWSTKLWTSASSRRPPACKSLLRPPNGSAARPRHLLLLAPAEADFATFRREPDRRRTADSGGRAGDDEHLVFESAACRRRDPRCRCAALDKGDATRDARERADPGGHAPGRERSSPAEALAGAGFIVFSHAMTFASRTGSRHLSL